MRKKQKRAPAAFFLLFSTPALALTAAPETGPCSLENAFPATVAAVDEDFDLLLDDGRRATLAGLEFPSRRVGSDLRAAARKRLSHWLSGRDVFVGPLSSAPDRWGRSPVRLFAASGALPEAPLVSVGAALLEAGEARFRPDPPAASCAKDYLAAEAPAREAARGVWADPAARPIDLAAPQSRGALLQRRGMAIVTGEIRSLGESRGSIYLNWGEALRRLLRRDFAPQFGYVRKVGIRSADAHWAAGARARTY